MNKKNKFSKKNSETDAEETSSKNDNLETSTNNEDDESFNQSMYYELPSERSDRKIDFSLESEERLHHLIPKLMKLNDKDKEILKNENIIVRNGRFSIIENAILKRNWERYLKDYHIPNKQLLLGHFQYQITNNDDKELKKAYRKFAQHTKLWLRLSKDLPSRTIYQIYCRARTLLPNLKKSKDFDENDRKNILKLHKIHGDHYATFCEKYGYSPKSAREVIRQGLSDEFKKGEWSQKELRKLRKYVDELVKELNLKSYDGIPWTRVSQKLKRNDIQCRQRFFSKAVMMLSPDDPPNWNDKLDMAKFISLLRKLNYNDTALIDWDYIKEKFSR